MNRIELHIANKKEDELIVPMDDFSRLSLHERTDIKELIAKQYAKLIIRKNALLKLTSNRPYQTYLIIQSKMNNGTANDNEL